MPDNSPIVGKTLAEGHYLGLYSHDSWEFCARPHATGVVGILPITHDQRIVLVEQFRIPVQKNVIEIPAGLVGDEPDYAGETLAECAGRELLEETGYRTNRITHLLSSPTSAGMTSETTHFFAATEITRETDGGGTEHEDITVHHVALDTLDSWLEQRQSDGCLIDFKIHACLWLARQRQLIKA